MSQALNEFRSVGDIVGDSIRTCRNQIPRLAKILILPTVAEIIGKFVMVWGASNELTQTASLFHMLWGLILILAGAIISLVADLYLTLRQLSIVRVTNGFARSYEESYAFLKTRKWQVVLLFLLFCLVLLVVIVFWTALIILATYLTGTKQGFALAAAAFGFCLVGGVVSSALISVPMCIIIPSMACEERPVFSLIGRGLSLWSRYFWRTIFFALLLAICVIALSAALGLPANILCFVEYARASVVSGRAPTSADIPIYAQVLSAGWHSLVNIFLSPVVFVAEGLFYFDLRTRQEGLDLTRSIEDLDSDPGRP